MSDYHEFIFDTQNRRFVGNFEGMYQAEVEHVFDAHHQDSLDERFDATTIIRMMQSRRYHKIIDVGCGKGALLNELSSFSDAAEGFDFSQTAIQRARKRYPSIRFELVDVSDPNVLEQFLGSKGKRSGYQILTVMSQVLSYIPDWRRVLEVTARHSDDLLVALYLPDNPIGYVESIEELRSAMIKFASIREEVTSPDGLNHVLFASSRAS